MDVVPSFIGRYQIRQQLGQGGMGVLYLAFDPAMDRLVALKVLRLDDAEWRERFLREARLVARLQHPNIITIHDVGSSDGQPFMAMEYIAGHTLDAFIRRRLPLARTRKLEILIALCDALHYAHRSGVIHRDVKPSNLIVHRDSGVLKVLDFGIARTVDSSLTMAGSIMGTPNYMSPEQVQGQVVDHRSDVFAVGVVLYELFAHRQAFSGDTPFLILRDIVGRTPLPLVDVDPTLDPRLDRIVARATAKDPRARYPDLDVMRRELIEALRHIDDDPASGREKTMVLLARASGTTGVDLDADGDVAVAAPPSTVVASAPPLAESDATVVTPLPAPPVPRIGVEEPASSGARLVRIALLAVAAVIVLIVLPAVLLRSRNARASDSGRVASSAAAQPPRTLLDTGTLPQVVAPLMPAMAGESGVVAAAAVTPAPRKIAIPERASVIRPAEPAAGRDDLKAMQRTLDRWKEAYQDRDLAAVTRVWPTISAAQAKMLETAFDKMTQMTVFFRQCSLAGSVARASATCRVERTMLFKTGRPETITSHVVFQLEKRAAKWVIVGVRGA